MSEENKDEIKRGNAEEDWKIFEILCESTSTEIMDPDLGNDVVTNLRSEIAGLQYKRDKLQQEAKDLKNQMLSKDQRMLEQQVEIDHLREQNARQNAIISSLRKKCQDLEENQRNLYAAQGRHDIAYQSLQRDCHFYEEKIKDLEKKLRNLEIECNNEEQHKDDLKSQFRDFIRRLSAALGYDCCDPSHIHSTESIVMKATELVQETMRLKSKCINISDNASSLEQELRSCRDLLERANSDKDLLQRQSSSQVLEIEKLKQDKDCLSAQIRMLEKDLDETKDRLSHCSKNFSAISENENQNQALIMQLKDDLKLKEDKHHRLLADFRNTLDSIAILLSLPSRYIEAQETAIKERIREILSDNKEKATQIEILKEKLSMESHNLHRTVSTQEQTAGRLRVLEDERNMLEAKVHKLENEISHIEISRDNLRRDKTNFVAFLERLGRTLNMDEISQEIGVELHTESILNRAEQLARLESDKVVDKTAVVYQLQRRIRMLREQIQRKDLHLDLLRRKLNVQEEGSKLRTILQAEKDEALAKIKKLNKQVDKLTLQLTEAKAQIREQNAQLADAADYKITALERARKIEELQKRLAEAESLRSRYNRKVNILRDQVRNTGEVVEQERSLSEHQIGLLKEDLMKTKEELADAIRREAQLTSFRNSIAKLLGILVPSTVSDLEMISRLQKLIDAHHDFTIVSRRYDDPALLRATSRSPPPSRCRTRTPDRSLRYDDSGYADPGYDIDDDLFKTRTTY